MKIMLIGTGNIAWQFGHRLHNKQIPIYGVYGRTPAKARELATQWNSKAYSDLQKLPDDADIYLFALSDQAYNDVIRDFPHRNKTMVHTSGTLPLSLFESLTPYRGVIYPFQSCTKGCELLSQRLPLCLEASDTATRAVIGKLAACFSEEIFFLDSRQRKQLHVAGVFANNFSNAMYRIAFGLLEKQHIDTAILHPLILETALKIQKMHPSKAQTGPAIRHDGEVMRSHLELLKKEKDEWSEVYQLMSRYIAEQHTI
ncbi:MAG: DUF2520 domain-containing protein [Bacteroidales bacterium]|jgi:predicted short-subunit dehydrogenase-like oxidoreductase (DUF2520 family)|nr:DUF2520 domain-containing protein [Bacteroidales bacterium]MBQ2488772.1 DUF2520 domain-containing protein [Bacteroidales bacterium]MCR5190303.1 DUF2520 domain-containing protein [Bacteroidales bacterium]